MKKEDIECMKEFTKKFESKFKVVVSAKPYRVNKFRDYINYGAETIYTTPKPKNFKETKWRKYPQEGMLWISTGINPNGVTSIHDIDRVYTIQFEQLYSERYKYARQWHTGTIHHFYKYGRTIDEVMTNFEEYLNKVR